MKELNYWDAFSNSGRIEDYLSYKQETAAADSTAVPEAPEAETAPGAGDSFYAGFSDDNRDDIEHPSYR